MPLARYALTSGASHRSFLGQRSVAISAMGMGSATAMGIATVTRAGHHLIAQTKALGAVWTVGLWARSLKPVVA